MNNNRYIFDKRVMKKAIKKYGLIFLCLFPIVVALNFAISPFVESNGLIIFIDVLVLLILIAVIEFLVFKINKWKDINKN